MRYILTLFQKQIEVEKLGECTMRTAASLKHEAVIYKDQSGEVCVRRKDEFLRLFQQKPA